MADFLKGFSLMEVGELAFSCVFKKFSALKPGDPAIESRKFEGKSGLFISFSKIQKTEALVFWVEVVDLVKKDCPCLQ